MCTNRRVVATEISKSSVAAAQYNMEVCRPALSCVVEYSGFEALTLPYMCGHGICVCPGHVWARDIWTDAQPSRLNGIGNHRMADKTSQDL